MGESTKLETALALAAEGFYVFPLLVNGKTPYLKFLELSSRNPETINNWWLDKHTGWPQDFNIGIDTGKSGLFVLDIDTKENKPGKANYLKLCDEIGDISGSRISVTASGGRHIWYKGSGFTNTQGDKGGIAPGLDTRGEGGYIAAPGSIIDGKEYRFLNNSPLLDMPEALKTKMAKHKKELYRDTSKKISVDEAGDVAWCEELLKEYEPAVQGSGGDHHTYELFCILKEHGLSIQTAVALADEHWNNRCSPPWDLEDLKRKASSAYKSAQNATGAKSAHAEFDLTVEEAKPAIAWFNRQQRFELSSIPYRQWVFGRLALRKNLTGIIAAAGIGKSTFTIAMALSKATGRNLLGIEPGMRGRVALQNNEDNMEELQRRVGAAMQFYGIPVDEVFPPAPHAPWLYLQSGENRMLKIAKRSGGGLRSNGAEEMAQELIALNIELFIVDPFAETHEGNENDNGELLKVGEIYRAITQKADCATVLVAHTRKPDNASAEGHGGDLHSLRGASSLGGILRVAATLSTMTEKQAKHYGIKQGERKHYVLLEGAKANFGVAGDNDRVYRREAEKINCTLDQPDGETVGVLRPVELKASVNVNTEAEKALIADVESLVEEGAKSIGAICAEFVESFPLHQGKNPESLRKAVQRLFTDYTIVESPQGQLELEDRPQLTIKAPRYWVSLRKGGMAGLE